MPRTSDSKRQADANNSPATPVPARQPPTVRPSSPLSSPFSAAELPSSPPLPLRAQAKLPLGSPGLFPLLRLIFLQSQACKAHRASLPIAAPDPDDSVLLAAHLQAKERERKDFNVFSIDDAAEISTNKAFLAHDLLFDKRSDETNTDDKDWEDLFPNNAQSSDSLESNDSIDQQAQSTLRSWMKDCNSTYAIYLPTSDPELISSSPPDSL